MRLLPQLDTDSRRHAELAGELEEVKSALAAHKDARKRSDNERRVEAAVEVGRGGARR